MNLFEATEEKLEEQLKPYLPLLCYLYKRVHEIVKRDFGHHLKDFRDGTTASIIHDMVVARVQRVFKLYRGKGIRTVDQAAYFCLVFDLPQYRILCRFNKFDDNFYTNKTITNSSCQFDEQQTTLFPDDKQNVNIYAGYVLSPDFSTLACYVSLPDGTRSNVFAFPINKYLTDRKIKEYEAKFGNGEDETNSLTLVRIEKNETKPALKIKITPKTGTDSEIKKAKRKKNTE